MLYGVSRRSNLSHPDLHTTRSQAAVARRTIHKITGLAPHSTLGIFNGDLNTLECALLERMYYCQVGDGFEAAPVPQRSDVNTALKGFKAALLSKSYHVTRLDLEEVVETYTGRKKVIYGNALESINRHGLSRRHATSCSFVKVEKGNTAKAPRCIQPRRPEYNLSLGRFIKPLEHPLYKWIAKVFGDGPTVMKGFNVVQVAKIARGKWDSFRCPVAVGLDATKFDMHVSAPMLAWEHGVYLSIFNQDPELRRLLSWQMHNRGVGYCEDGKLRYKVEGKRFSGDMNTALGNCLIMCGLVWAYSGVRGVRTKLVNNGDDCVVFMERDDLEVFMGGLDEWFLRMGFRMTVEEPVFEFEKVEFCQMRPVRTQRGWTMVRNIPTALAKDTMSVVPLVTEQLARRWMHAVGECGLALCAGVPVLQAFYLAYLREGRADQGKLANSLQMASGMRMMAVGLVGETLPVSDEARLGVYISWGITPDEQRALEDEFALWAFEYDTTDIVEPVLHSDVLCLPR